MRTRRQTSVIDHWVALRREHPLLRNGSPLIDIPAPLSDAALRQLAASIIFRPEHRQLLRSLVREVLEGQP